MLSQGPRREGFADLGGRVTFMQYDFYTPQPIHDAGLFFLRQVTHNYNDETCIRIFRAFVPALEQCADGTALLINDMILPGANEKPKVEELALRQVDMAMLTGYGAKQRTKKEFLKLLKEADPRFEVSSYHLPNPTITPQYLAIAQRMLALLCSALVADLCGDRLSRFMVTASWAYWRCS